jgi:hypothetical protein
MRVKLQTRALEGRMMAAWQAAFDSYNPQLGRKRISME